MTVFMIMAMPMIVVGKPVAVKAIVLAMMMAVVSMTGILCAHGPSLLRSRALRTTIIQMRRS